MARKHHSRRSPCHSDTNATVGGGQRLTPPDTDDEVINAHAHAHAQATTENVSTVTDDDVDSVAATLGSGDGAIEEPEGSNAQQAREASPQSQFPTVIVSPHYPPQLSPSIGGSVPVYLPDILSDYAPSAASDAEQEGQSSGSSPVPPHIPPTTPPPDPREAWKQNCDLVDWEAEVDLDEQVDIDDEWLSKTPEGIIYSTYLKETTPPAAFLKPAYTPHGKWSFTYGTDMENVRIIKELGEGGFAKVYIKQGTIYGEEITFISKEWDLKDNSNGFYSELALYACPKYLRTLQGVCVPHLIGLFRNQNRVAVAFELPHADSWMEAHAGMPLEIKERIINAYKQIHKKGVLHNDVGLRHILVGDDHKVTIIDFNVSRALEDHWSLRLKQCRREDLDRELREVKVKLRYDDAIRNELKLIDRYNELKAEAVAARRLRIEAERAERAERRKKRKSPVDEEEDDILSDTDQGEDEEVKLHGVVEATLQNEGDLTNWLITKCVSRRLIVPGRDPNWNSLPPADPQRREDEITTSFLTRLIVEENNGVKTAPPTRNPTPIPTPPTPIPKSSRSIWSLPRRVLRAVNSYFTTAIPLSLASRQPEQEGTSDPEMAQRPRKRQRTDS